MKYIIANWKANKTLSDTQEWLDIFLAEVQKIPSVADKVTIIICPPSPLLQTVALQTKAYPFISVGSQDVSTFEGGSYTGEVTAKTVASVVEYALVGHSERRRMFNETEEVIASKTTLATANGLKTVLCVRNNEDLIHEGISCVAYEPVAAIGTGNNEKVSEVEAMKKQFNFKTPVPFLYGGSVNEENAREYLSSPEIDGLLVGSASLDPRKFAAIISKA